MPRQFGDGKSRLMRSRATLHLRTSTDRNHFGQCQTENRLQVFQLWLQAQSTSQAVRPPFPFQNELTERTARRCWPRASPQHPDRCGPRRRGSGCGVGSPAVHGAPSKPEAPKAHATRLAVIISTTTPAALRANKDFEELPASFDEHSSQVSRSWPNLSMKNFNFFEPLQGVHILLGCFLCSRIFSAVFRRSCIDFSRTIWNFFQSPDLSPEKKLLRRV